MRRGMSGAAQRSALSRLAAPVNRSEHRYARVTPVRMLQRQSISTARFASARLGSPLSRVESSRVAPTPYYNTVQYSSFSSVEYSTTLN